MKILNKKIFILLSLSTFTGLFFLMLNISYEKNSLENLESANSEEQIFGGIVSHHLLVESEIDRFFSKFENQDIETIVIIGPNHFGSGEGGIMTKKSSFLTTFGELEIDIDVVDSLIKDGNVSLEEDPFGAEHSITALTKFVKKYLPKAKIVPIIIKLGDFNEGRLDELVRDLENVLPQKSAVIASVDFSHHLNSNSADFHDELSLNMIESFDFSRIKKIEVDSPASIYVALKLLENRGAQKMSYYQTNSAKFLGNIDSEDVTSYLFAYFFKGVPFAEKKISVLSFGDAMFDRDVRDARENGIDVFAGIRGVEGNFLRGYDLATLNLEGPITDIEKEKCQDKPNIFRFPKDAGEMLFENNISAVNLANNHIVDCFDKGVGDTKNALRESNIDFFMSGFGEDKYFKKEIGGREIVFMGFDISLNDEYLKINYQKIRDLKNKDNVIVVNLHWGIEYETKSSNIQKEFAHKLVDSGADIIIGHHPHVTQEVEIYEGKTIFYSLGNFIFDQVNQETKKGFAVGSVFGEIRDGFYIFPYQVNNYAPKLLNQSDARIFCDDLLKNIPNKDGCFFMQEKTL